MGPLIISIAFWFVGILVILAGSIMSIVLRRIKLKMDKKSEAMKHNDNEVSIQYAMAENVIDIIPWYYVRLLFTIVGMVIIALGFVSLGFLRI